MREDNTDIDLKDYSATVRYLEQLQETSIKTFTAELQKSGSENSAEPVSPAPFSMYAPGRGLYGSQPAGTKRSNQDQRGRCLSSRMRGFSSFNSFNQEEIEPGLGGERMILSERGAHMFDYHYTQHNTHCGMSTSAGLNFVNVGNTTNGFAAENPTASFSRGVGSNCLSPTLQDCPQSISMNPLAGLTELAEKANFASELSQNGVAVSRFSSQQGRGQINGQAVQYSYPEAPRSRSWSGSTHESAGNFVNGRQQPFQTDDFSPALSTGGSVFSDSELGSPCQPTRARQFFAHSESDSEITPTEASPFDRSRTAYQNYTSRSFANYRLWSNQAESITPNVTVVPDPRSKLSQLFRSGRRTKSEEILKEHLQNFSKFLPPQGEEEEEKATQNDNEKSWNSDDSIKEKKPSTVASSAQESSSSPSEENTVFPCKWVGCDGVYSERDDLVRHIEKVHIDQRKADDLYICYWKDCSRQRRAFNARY